MVSVLQAEDTGRLNLGESRVCAEQEDVFRCKLIAGEGILWAGRPDPDIYLTPADRFIVPFSIAWCSMALLWDGVVICLILTKDPSAGDSLPRILCPIIGAVWLLLTIEQTM